MCAKKLIKEENLLRRFEEIQDYIYANDGLSSQQTLEEFVKILFLKLNDENLSLNLFKISSVEYTSIENGTHKDGFLKNLDLLLKKTIEQYPDLFDEDERIKLSLATLAYIVSKLQNISLAASSQDAKGLAFQKFLSHCEKDGKGQFFTPEPVVDFCVKFINPQLGETIIDPCCGSGGFLFSSLLHLKEQGGDVQEIVKSQIYGVDINRSIARIAKMKLLLESNVTTNLYCRNSLDDIDNLLLTLDRKEKFDVLLTNPPFGTYGKIISKSVLSHFELGYKWSTTSEGYSKSNTLQSGQSAEVLFVERCLSLLKDGGRMGIVLPNGHFENSSLSYLREYIKQYADIIGVVALPSETFIPFGTGVKTSILFLRKKESLKPQERDVFFSKVERLGYQGNKNGTPLYKKDKNGNICKERGVSLLDEDFSEIIADYRVSLKGRLAENLKSFTLPFSELGVRFDYELYSPSNRELIKRLSSGKAVRLAEVVDIIKVKSPKLKDQSLKVDYVELSDINSHSFEIINSNEYLVHELPSRASYELKQGDVITAIAGNSVGTRKHATALVSDEFEGAICTNGFRILRDPKINIYYLLYYLRSEAFLKQVYMYRTGAAIPAVSDRDLGDILIYIPDKKSIKKISKCVERSFQLRSESRKELESIGEIFEF